MCSQEDYGSSSIDKGIRKCEHALVVQIYVQDRAVDFSSIHPAKALPEAICGTDYSAARHLNDAFYIDGNDGFIFDQEDGNIVEIVGINEVHGASSAGFLPGSLDAGSQALGRAGFARSSPPGGPIADLVPQASGTRG